TAYDPNHRDTGYAYITKYNVNMRTAPNGTLIVQLNVRDVVQVIGQQTAQAGIWYNVILSRQGLSGCIRADMLRI
ncbi:MAG: hypothetical protein RR482_06780, partial [Clostridia bacterium]